MRISEIDADLLEALRERGWSDSNIEQLTPQEMFKEYCGWHLGDPGWGTRLWRVAISCGIKEKKK